MAPRFVEVSKPVEAGVKWATTMHSGLSAKLSNITGAIRGATESFGGILPTFKLFADLRECASYIINLFPSPTTGVKMLLLSSLLILVCRSVFVFARSRSIVALYGAAKVIEKEQ